MDAVTMPASVGTMAEADYPALFRTYIANGTRHALQQIRTNPSAIYDGPTRESVLNLLSFALDAPHVYLLARELVQRITPVMEQAGFWELWIPYLSKAVTQSRRQQDQPSAAFCAQWLGQLYQQQSKFTAAHDQFMVAMQLFAALGDLGNQAKSLNRLAYLARLQRRYTEAEQFVTQAMALLPPTNPERSFSYFVQGVIAFDRQEWSLAVQQLQASLAISEQYDDKITIARRLRNLGPALRALGRYAEAIQCYERAIALFNTIHDPVQQAVTQMNLGVVYLLTEQPALALEQFTRAEPVFRTAHDRLHLAMVYTNQGIAHRMMATWGHAQSALESAIDLWQKLNNLPSQVNALDELALTYLEQGQGERALRVLQQAFTLLEQVAYDPAYDLRRNKLLKHQEEAKRLINGCPSSPLVRTCSGGDKGDSRH